MENSENKGSTLEQIRTFCKSAGIIDTNAFLKWPYFSVDGWRARMLISPAKERCISVLMEQPLDGMEATDGLWTTLLRQNLHIGMYGTTLGVTPGENGPNLAILQQLSPVSGLSLAAVVANLCPVLGKYILQFKGEICPQPHDLLNKIAEIFGTEILEESPSFKRLIEVVRLTLPSADHDQWVQHGILQASNTKIRLRPHKYPSDTFELIIPLPPAVRAFPLQHLMQGLLMCNIPLCAKNRFSFSCHPENNDLFAVLTHDYEEGLHVDQFYNRVTNGIAAVAGIWDEVMSEIRVAEHQLRISLRDHQIISF